MGITAAGNFREARATVRPAPQFLRRVRSTGVWAVVLGLILSGPAPARAGATVLQPLELPAAYAGKIGPEVQDRLAGDGVARVMIALRQTDGMRRGTLNLSALRQDVGQLQAEVLGDAGPAGFQPRQVYAAVPALAGQVTSLEALAALARHPNVTRIDIDVGGSGSLADAVPLIGAQSRHEAGNKGAGIVVAVLDSGLDSDHVNLGGDLVAEACFLDNDGSVSGTGLCPNGSDRQTGPGAAEDDAGHGTHVTGIITSGGLLGAPGVSPDTSIVSLKVLAGPTFSGVFQFFSEIVAALDYVITNPGLQVQVINMSLGTSALFEGDCDTSTAYNMAGAAAINTLRARGVTAIAAAGNNSSATRTSSPACLGQVISVGASRDDDTASGFSNSNAATDLFAPGVGIVSSGLADTLRTASGTSMAAPLVTACAALLLETGEATTPDQIETRLETSPATVSVASNGLGFPRLDCSRPGTDPRTPVQLPTDIKPNDPDNTLNPDWTGQIWVSVFSTSAFSLTETDRESVRFGPGGASPNRFRKRDFNGDGRIDVKARFAIPEVGFACGMNSLEITGTTTDGRHFAGVDGITPRGCAAGGTRTVEVRAAPFSRERGVVDLTKSSFYVAFLSANGFDPASVAVDSVVLGATGAAPRGFSLPDRNRDGVGDLRLRYKTADGTLGCGHQDLDVTAATDSGESIRGTLRISVTGC